MSFQTNARGLRLGFFRKWDSTDFNNISNYNDNIFKYLNTLKYLENMLEFTKHNISLIKTNYIKLGTKKIYIILYYHNLNLDDEKLYYLLLNRNDNILDNIEKKIEKKYFKLYLIFYYKKLYLRQKLKKKKKKSIFLKKNIYTYWKNKNKQLLNNLLKQFKVNKQTITLLGEKEIKPEEIYKSFFNNFIKNYYLIKNKNKQNDNLTSNQNKNTNEEKTKQYEQLIIEKIKSYKKKKFKSKIQKQLYRKNLNKHWTKKTQEKKTASEPINNGKIKQRKIQVKNANLKKKNLYNIKKYILKIYYTKLQQKKKQSKINHWTTYIIKDSYYKLKQKKKLTKKKIKYYYNINDKTNLNQLRFFYFNKNFSLNNGKKQNIKIQWICYKYLTTQINNLLKKKQNIYIYHFFKKNLKNNIVNIYKKKYNNKKFNKYDKDKIINILNIKKLKKNLSILTNTNINLFLINSKNLLKFALNNIDERLYFWNLFKKSNNYYDSIVENYLDIIYMFFYSFLFKDAKILTKLIIFIFKKKRRYVRDGSVVNFIRQILPTIINHFPDIDAVRIKIKGRLNNRKRAKTDFIRHNLITNHKISYFTDYDSSTYITTSGALGFKIWISFLPNAKQNYISLFKKYLIYSNLKNGKKI